MCKCPLELDKRKRIFKKQSKGFSSFHAKIVVEGFLVEYRKKPGLGLCTFLHCRSLGLGGQAGDGVATSPREQSWSAAQGPGGA